MYAFVLEGVLLTIVGIFGIVGNIGALFLFGKQRMHKHFHYLMMGLASYDLTYIMVAIFVFALPQFFPGFNETAFYCYSLPFVLPLAQIGLSGSIFFTIALTIERYLTVCHPFYLVAHDRSVGIYIIPIVIFTWTFNLPRFFELDVAVLECESFTRVLLANGFDSGQIDEMDNDGKCQAIMDTVKNITDGLVTSSDTIPSEYLVYVNTPTVLRQSKVYVELFCGWINFIVHNLLPYCFLIVLNIIILRKLQTSLAEMSSKRVVIPLDSTSVPEYVQLAKISLVIVFVFIVSHIFRWIPNVFELYLFYMSNDGHVVVQWPTWVELASNLSHVLTVFNSSVNFYIYVFKHQSLYSHWVCFKRKRMETGTETEMMKLNKTAVVVA